MDNAILKDVPTEILQGMMEGETGVINLIQSEITRINAYTNKSSYAVELLVIRNEYVTAYETVRKELIDRGIKVKDAFKITGRPEDTPVPEHEILHKTDKEEAQNIPEPVQDDAEIVPPPAEETAVEGKSNKE